MSATSTATRKPCESSGDFGRAAHCEHPGAHVPDLDARRHRCRARRRRAPRGPGAARPRAAAATGPCRGPSASTVARSTRVPVPRAPRCASPDARDAAISASGSAPRRSTTTTRRGRCGPFELADHHRAGAGGRRPVHEADRVAVDVLAHAAGDLRDRVALDAGAASARGRRRARGSYARPGAAGARPRSAGRARTRIRRRQPTSPSGLALRTSTTSVGNDPAPARDDGRVARRHGASASVPARSDRPGRRDAHPQRRGPGRAARR